MTASAITASYDSATRPGAVGLVLEGIREVWSRRRLITYLVRADLKKKGSDTLLGNLWWIVDPLLQMLVYVVLVTVIRASSVVDYPMFIFAAILPWKWFTSAVGDAIGSVTSQGPLIKQINFPKLILPLANVLAGIVNFAFGLIPLFVMLVFLYNSRLSAWVLLIPVVAAVQLLFTLAVSIVAAAVNVFFRDVGNISRHALRMWFYLSPALYSTASVDELARKNPAVGVFFAVNPFTPLFESYRNLIYSDAPPLWAHLAILAIVSIVLIGLSTWTFKRLEPTFAKVL
jgi:lipopolysaccharide transport system permease protein